MPRRTALLVVASLAAAMTVPLSISGQAQAQPGDPDRGFGTRASEPLAWVATAPTPGRAPIPLAG